MGYSACCLSLTDNLEKEWYLRILTDTTEKILKANMEG